MKDYHTLWKKITFFTLAYYNYIDPPTICLEQLLNILTKTMEVTTIHNINPNMKKSVLRQYLLKLTIEMFGKVLQMNKNY